MSSSPQARSHYFYSGFRPMSTNNPSAHASNHYKNSGFRQAKEKHFLVRGAKKSFFLRVKISRFVEAHRDLSHSASCLRNTYFYSVFWTSRSAIVEKCTFLKTSKTRDREANAVFERFAAVLGGPETPFFVVFSRSPKDRVQLSSLEATKIGFN